MLLKARIDAPGALHHIISRGIKRRRIFSNDQDRDDFMEPLGKIVTKMKTPCFGWVLIPNHAHFLFQTGKTPLTMIMNRLLTGYVVSYNHRHRRHENLIHSGWKSAISLNSKLRPKQSSDSGNILAGDRSRAGMERLQTATHI
jgi:REP element-mobilizing transposase RayT